MWVLPGRTAPPSRSASPTSARSMARMPSSSRSIVRRAQSRRSVATWSLRERPVCSRPASGPIRVASAASMFRWISSSAGSQVTLPASTSERRDSRPATRASTSVGVSRPALPRPRTWATEPVRSSAARAASTSIERVKSAVRGSVPPANRPPQSRMGSSPSVQPGPAMVASAPASPQCSPRDGRRPPFARSWPARQAPGASASSGARRAACSGRTSRARPAPASARQAAPPKKAVGPTPA